MVSPSLRAFLDSLLPRYLEELADLVAIDSPSSHKEGTEEVGRWFAERYRALGAEVAFEAGALAGMPAPLEPPRNVARHLLATFRGEGGGRVLLLGHVDTVFPVGEAARRPFRAEGERAYGPGVADMKGCILSALYALEGLLASGFGSFGEILVLYDSDEEVGNPSSRPLIEELAPGCDAVLVLESARSDGSLVSARKGSSLFRLEVEGVAAHAGVEPEKGRSAVLELARKVVAAHAIARAGSEGTTNVTHLSGGARPFIVPPEAAATVEFRAYSAAELARMERELRALAGQSSLPGTRTRLVPLGGRPVMERTEGTARLVALAQEVARAGGFEVAESATGGGSDGNYTAALGVPTLDGLGPVGGNLHREDEYLEIPSVPERAWLLAEMVRRLGEGRLD